MSDEDLKKLIEEKKEDILQSFKNRLTYDKWDKQSPIYTYISITDEVEEITDVKRIKFLLQDKQSFTYFFSNKKDLDTYRWIIKTIEEEVDSRITESFNDRFASFAKVEDVTLGEPNLYYMY